jgi:hypothetical protein
MQKYAQSIAYRCADSHFLSRLLKIAFFGTFGRSSSIVNLIQFLGSIICGFLIPSIGFEIN